MEIYILKFSICLGLFILFYKLFLENQSMHRFKRFYLLTGIAFALCTPLLTFTVYVEPVIATEYQQPFSENFNTVQEKLVATEPAKTNYLPIILWTIYSLGVLLFSAKFTLNLRHIISKVRKNETQKSRPFTYVLLNKVTIPHSFFNYIFLNKDLYKSHQIPKEALIHEQTHAQQKHSIDVLAVELLQIVFWFNPLIYILKHTIKLNHEFLADEAVINQGVAPSVYQKLLIAFSSNANVQPASAFNYSSIKKRFKVMKTHTSQRSIWLRSFIILPLIAFSIYGFSDRKEVIKPLEEQVSTSDYTARSISIEILEDGTYKIDGISASKSTLVNEVNKLHQDITPEIRNNIMNIHVTSLTEISNEEVWFIYNSLLDYGFYRLVTPKQEVVKGNGNTPFAIEQTQQQQQQQDKEKKVGYSDNKKYVIKGGNWNDVEAYLTQDKEVIKDINIYIDKNDKLFLNNNPVTLENLADKINALNTHLSTEEKRKFLQAIIIFNNPNQLATSNRITKLLAENCNVYSTMASSETSKKSNQNQYAGKSKDEANEIYENETLDFSVKESKTDSPWKIEVNDITFIESDSPTSLPKITEKDIQEYNAIAKKINAMPKDKRIIKTRDYERMNEIYNRLSDEQKKKAEPYPKLLE